MANKLFSCVISFSWFLIFLFQLQQIQSAAGSNAKSSMEVIPLRVGVPKKDGFPEFVNVVWDSHQNEYNVTGYCMDVFHAVVNLLPFNVSLKIEPYVNESRESAGTYDSLVQQVPTKYDVVVGDITIVANRSKFVDFTLPYSESGVRMLVAVLQQGRHKEMWIFVKPFSWDLWLSIILISMFIGFVIHIMERNNAHTLQPDQKQDGSPYRKQLSAINILWFPISQAVLPERQVVAKNCSRFVLMVWLLLAFVLMQSYTANLTENNDLIDGIEEIYFGKNGGGGQDQGAQVSSSSASSSDPSFTAHSFEGLFLITVISTLLAVLISETVIWQRPISMAKEYSQRYLSRSSTPPLTQTRVHPDDHSQGIQVVEQNINPDHHCVA